MKNYIVTGISGSGRIELLNELQNEFKIKSDVFDIGKIIFESAKKQGIEISDSRILDVDKNLLIALWKIAFDQILFKMAKNDVDYNFIGIHATFRWKERLIKGVTYHDLKDLEIDGFLNIIDDVANIHASNIKNPKWDKDNVPETEETNYWMMEEEFITEVLADFFTVPIYLIGRNHNIKNLADLFLTTKLKFYLSYPITAIEKDDPELLKKIRNKILPMLEERFVVFDPLVIKDMKLTHTRKIDLPDKIEQISEKALKQIMVRTVERDYQFID